MIKAIIIDDEQHCIDRLQTLLVEYCVGTIEVCGAFKNFETGLDGIRRLKPGLVFLDVELGDKKGFDLLQKLTETDFAVIFTTAHQQYAVTAFKFSALDYLLKPIDPDDLLQAVEKLKDKNSREELATKMDALFYNLKSLQGATKRISVPTVSGLSFIDVSDIIRCQSDINYTTIFLKDKQKLIVAKTLKEFENLLSGYNFFRVHNSHLINLTYIKNYNKGKGGYVSLSDNSVIEVSTRRKEEFLKRLAMM
jgi:two-component system, LytTR family, response regulator